MNVPGNIMKARSMKSAYEVLGISTYISDDEATEAQLCARDLYVECSRQVLKDGFDLHVMMMPGMKGPSLVYGANGDDDFSEAVENLTGASLKAEDMVVVLGDDIIDGDLGENEMMEVVMSDIATHIDHLWPVADRATGWFGSHIGWAAVAGVIAGSHGVIRMLEPSDAVMERIKDAAAKGIVRDPRGCLKDKRLAALQNRPAMEAIENVCGQASETHGGYLSLPATGMAIANAAKTIFLEAVDSMVQPPRPIV